MRKWNLFTTNEIKPKGWLKKQLEIQAAGLSGNLDKIWSDIKESAWIGGSKEGWERVPYWLDGFIPLAYLLENKDMIERAKKYIDSIVSFQKSDGWICPCEDSEREEYDTWAVLLISKVLTVYYECSKDDRIPDVIYNVLKNYYDLLMKGEIRLFNWGKFRWYEGLIAINFIYKRCNESWLLELAKILKNQGADYNDFTELWKRPLNRWRFETHIVNLMMMLKYEALYCELFDADYTDNAEYLYKILKEYNGTPVETFTGDECLSGLSAIQGTELCSVVEEMYSYELLFAFTGDNKWAERLEVVAFNALPATVSDDMWTHQYVQMSNQIACEKFPGKSLFRTNSSEAHLFGLEPNFGCCTANFNQGFPKLALSAFMFDNNEVISAIPLPSELKTEDKHIVLETVYPFVNSFKYTIYSKSDFIFKIRIPSFAEKVKVNNKSVTDKNLNFAIKANENKEIIITFDTVPYLEERTSGLNTIKCGSFVFSIPIKFEKKMYEFTRDGVERKYPYCDYELLPLSDWNYALTGNIFTVFRNNIANIPFSSDEPPVVIKAKARKINWGLEDGYENVCARVPESLDAVSDEEEITLYPYGCSKLRITEIPII